jgi:hypothetical protein
MKGSITQRVLFIFWTILAILSMAWIIFNIINFYLLLTEFTFQFVFILACLSFFISMLSINVLLTKVKFIMNLENEKQRNIRDVYRYEQLLDPPDTNMYN